jgi:hypothetical protein
MEKNVCLELKQHYSSQAVIAILVILACCLVIYGILSIDDAVYAVKPGILILGSAINVLILQIKLKCCGLSLTIWFNNECCSCMPSKK